jgi:hypothetical protein
LDSSVEGELAEGGRSKNPSSSIVTLRLEEWETISSRRRELRMVRIAASAAEARDRKGRSTLAVVAGTVREEMSGRERTRLKWTH